MSCSTRRKGSDVLYYSAWVACVNGLLEDRVTFGPCSVEELPSFENVLPGFVEGNPSVASNVCIFSKGHCNDFQSVVLVLQKIYYHL